MDKLLSWTQSFFDRQTIWMHITAILMMSFFFMKLSQLYEASVFFGWVGSSLLFAIPTIIFVLIRDLSSPERGKRYWMLWTLAFVGYPVFLFMFKLDIQSLSFTDYMFNNDIDGQVAFLSVAVVFLLVELIVFFGSRSTTMKNRPKILTQMSVFKLALIIVFLFSGFLMLSNSFISTYMNGKSLSYYPLRYLVCFFILILTYLSYYIYYYIHHHILYNIILKRRGLLPYFIGLALTVLLVSPLHNYLISCLPYIAELKLHTIGLAPYVFDDLNFGLPILVLFGSFPLIVIIEWYQQANALSELEKQQSKTELYLLRQQINPHFFFNTLNNLYSMSLTNDKATSETIMQLSELMRYVIYKGKEDQVELREEVKYIKDYVNLQMIRVFKKVDLKLDFDITSEQVMVPPLLFIVLVENAIKHGIEPAGSESILHITLRESAGVIEFECINSIEVEPASESKGIGLENLQKRLKILYPDTHVLTLEKRDKIFRAALNIFL